jgi:Transmembrane secretion effector
VTIAGAVAAFICNALLYVPLLIVLYRWRPAKEPSRLPPERLRRAVISGVRYVIHSPPIRVVLARTFLVGIIGGSITALMPLVARDLLGGGAQIYGIMQVSCTARRLKPPRILRRSGFLSRRRKAKAPSKLFENI